uniref:UPAR/Ly6 domain-containing protein qvr n=1 Tax=Plectus sambesii TaxID=2011161 RepID=A0A914WRD0_9BILA
MALHLLVAALIAFCSIAFAADVHDHAGQQKQCYSCTTTNLERFLSFHMTPDWRKHVLDTPLVNVTEHCQTMHTHEDILASGIMPIPCDDGICAEMTAKEENGTIHVWRGCLSNPKDSIAANCDHTYSDDGTHWQACACEGSLCNGASRMTISYLIVLIVALSFAVLFSN